MGHDSSHLRQEIAQVSARLIVQEGITDYHLAKRKAAAQLGISQRQHLPSNEEIRKEVLIYQRLFQAKQHPQQLATLRATAMEAMRLLSQFQPRLVGEVLEGTAHRHSGITLHLFTDSPEEVAFFLMEKGIPYRLGERRFRLPETVNYPCYQFVAGTETVALIVFKINDIRWSPPDPIDGKPMRRADLSAVRELMNLDSLEHSFYDNSSI